MKRADGFILVIVLIIISPQSVVDDEVNQTISNSVNCLSSYEKSMYKHKTKPEICNMCMHAIVFNWIKWLLFQVGKGCSVGLNQIAMFQGKVACGNGEQSLSRDMYRLGQLFDFFRMMSFYISSIGFYVCCMVMRYLCLLCRKLWNSLSMTSRLIYRWWCLLFTSFFMGELTWSVLQFTFHLFSAWFLWCFHLTFELLSYS